MKIKHYLLYLVAVSLLVLLPACTRTASTPDAKAADATTDVEFPVLTESGPTQPPVEVFGTQTAQAMNGELTMEAPAIVETPTPEIVEAVTEAPTEAPQAAEQSAATSTPLSNATASSPGFPVFEGYGAGFPTFGIRGVVKDQTVTIQANDFPANQTYTVMMGPMYTGAVNGTVIATQETGEGGDYLETYDVPAALQGSDRIAIRIEFSGGRYAVNWFYNNTTY